jgi:putative phage-type endonuclease
MATVPVISSTAEVVADTRGLSRAAWLALRRSGIGGSDAATVLGLNPYATALDLYLAKLGLAVEPPETEAMWWGRALEPVVAARFGQTMPFTVHEIPQMLRHRQYPFLLANIDRVLLDPDHPDRGPGILEVKAPGARQLAHWGPDKAPDHYLIQVQHYLAVTGFSWAYLAARVGNQQTYFLPVERDDAFITALIRAEADFWERVQTRRPPPLDGSDSAAALVKGLYPTATRPSIALPAAAQADADAWWAANAAEQAAHAAKQAAETALKARLGDAEGGTVGPYRIQWANRTRRGVDGPRLTADHPDLAAAYHAETAYRVFLVRRKELSSHEDQ